jgi:hypothetical protein
MAKVITILAAAMMITATAHAEPLKPVNTYCNHIPLKRLWYGLKCGYYAGSSLGLVNHAEKLERRAKETDDLNKQAKLKNEAAYDRAEADRYADEYRRTYAPK